MYVCVDLLKKKKKSMKNFVSIILLSFIYLFMHVRNYNNDNRNPPKVTN